ncbi:C1 family peptidase [Azospira restricta]|uniref:Peptidase C1 n=1 Tax=Azospira restricta TaxID=404405 RepID=A0A974SMA8_9RHOO|nr:C1 family peptidase [Azospira restricta]QRJ62272.1 hypothetical protein IWH25_10730 [Azospira restricta]
MTTQSGRPVRNANRDAFDRRDLIYSAPLVELPATLLPNWDWIEPLDQGKQGACTGFGLAAAINFLLAARRCARARGPEERVSARMLFQMARRYDQWAGENYDWSSARGAMKGWFRTGVCSEALWPNKPAGNGGDRLTRERQLDALRTPLGAYYRILPRRNDVHAALVEAGVVYAVADTHDGWDEAVGAEAIDYQPGAGGGGGHAFAIVGYTADGFLVQNSWGRDWGGFKDADGRRRAGVALWRYADFDANVWDLWVARLALPVESLAALGAGGYRAKPGGGREKVSGPPQHEIRGHYLHIDDGQYDPRGRYPSDAGEVDEIVGRLVDGGTRHLLLFAHGGLNTVDGAATRVARWQPVFADNGIAELHFIWETGFLAELRDVLLGKERFVEERVAGVSDWWDDWVERASQPLGHALWHEMRSDAEVAFAGRSAAGRHFVDALVKRLAASGQPPQVHLVCHSAGAIWMGHLLDAWRRAGGPAIDNLILFAPACTVDFFFDKYAALPDTLLKTMRLFQLDDDTERDDNVAVVYRKSLLYLVSRAFEEKGRVVPLLGMAKHAAAVDARLAANHPGKTLQRFVTGTHPQQTRADSHGGFDNDPFTMNHMLQLVLGGPPPRPFAAADLDGY